MLSCDCSSSKNPHIEIHILHMEVELLHTCDKVKLNTGYEMNVNSKNIMKHLVKINKDFTFPSI